MRSSNASGWRLFHASKKRRITALFCSVVALTLKLPLSYESRMQPDGRDNEAMIASLAHCWTVDGLKSKFAVQGGDWGGITASRLGYAHPDKLIGIHLNRMAVRREPE